MLLLLTTAALAGGPDCSKSSCAKTEKTCPVPHARWAMAGVGLVGSSWSVLAPAIAEVNSGDKGDAALRVTGLLGAGVSAVSLGMLVVKTASGPPPSKCATTSLTAAPPPPEAAPPSEGIWTVEPTPSPAAEEPAAAPPAEVDEVWAVEPVDQPVDPWVIEEDEEPSESDEPDPWGPL